MAELHWFPFFASDWLSSPSVLSMQPEQRGAFIHLLAIAWGNGESEPSLPSSAASLASLSGLGARWKRLGPAVRQQFAERDGRLYNAKLSDVWQRSQEQHEKAVARGIKGGKAKAAKRKTVSSSTREQAVVAPLAESKPLSSSELLVEPTALTSTFPPKALGVETPRPAERPVDRDIRTGKAEQVNGIAARFMARFGQRPVEAT